MCEVSETFYISLKPKNANNSNTEKEKPVVLAGHPVCNYSFVDKLWQFEIAGGQDQNAPLTVINVGKNGLAKRSGIKVGDQVAFINNISTENMTLKEAQMEILDAGRSLKIIVRGDSEESSNSSEEEGNTVDFWFKPLSSEQFDLMEWQKKRDEKRKVTKQIYQEFPWNDRKKPSCRESNCFMATKPKERAIKLKATKERYIESEKLRLTELEMRRPKFV